MENYSSFIHELYQLDKIITSIEKVLKTNGLSGETIRPCHGLLQAQSKGCSKESQSILTGLDRYLITTFEQVKGTGALLCTSDIIESAFGKYKNFSSDNKMACVTKMVLILSAITVEPEEDKIKHIFEKVKMEDIDRWAQTHIGQTSFKRRRDLLARKKVA